MSASVIKGYARASSMDELDVVGSVMTIGPSVIMGLTCLYLRQAITANLCFHAFMLFAILTSGWSLSGPKNRILHREGSFAELPLPQEKHRARRYDEVEEAQRRLRQREAQLRAPKAERSSEEAGQHLLLFVRCGSTFVVRAPIDARRASAGEVVALWLFADAGN